MRAVYNGTIKFNYLRGRVKFPTGGQSPRAQADLVKFQNRQYSLDDRRYRINKLTHTVYYVCIFTVLDFSVTLIFHTFQSRFKIFKVVFFISNVDLEYTFFKNSIAAILLPMKIGKRF